jgi:hypothetical protein
MVRQQLPPQIRKVEVLDRKTGKTVVRYQLTVDAGVNPQTGKRLTDPPPVRHREAGTRRAVRDHPAGVNRCLRSAQGRDGG